MIVMSMTIEERIEIFKKENEEDLKEGGCFEGWTDDDIRWQIEENLKGHLALKEPSYNKSMPKLIVEGREVKKGDWIVVEGDNWEEDGCVTDIDDKEINMFDGKEGWFVKRDEIRRVYFK
jgi:hypothetical protein